MKENLEELIPEGNLAVYHHLRQMLLDFGTTESLLAGFEIADEIRERLNTLKNRGFIKEQEAAFIFDSLADALCGNENTGKLIANKSLLRRRGNQRDWNLNLLIYLTVSDLKTYRGKPHYGAVAEHLKELQIYGRNDEPLPAKAVEDIYKGIRQDDVKFLLDMLYAVHYGNEPLPKDKFIPWELVRKYDKRGVLGPGCCVIGLSITNPSYNPFR